MAILQESERRFVWETMGTVVSLASAAPLNAATTSAAMAVFDAYDQQFSLYKPDSEASRLNRERAPLSRSTPSYQAAYDVAWQWKLDTDGAFQPHRPDGVTDLSGVVKALAIRDASTTLTEHGVGNFLLNAGGDMWAEGTRDGAAWVSGIIDPADRQQLLSEHAHVDGRRALATSGTRERGEHIWRLDDHRSFVQVSVAADDILTADVLATAIMSGGVAFYVDAVQRWDIDVLAATADGQYYATAAFRA